MRSSSLSSSRGRHARPAACVAGCLAAWLLAAMLPGSAAGRAAAAEGGTQTLGEAFPFVADLIAPVDRDCFVREAAQGRPGDVVIDATWQVEGDAAEPTLAAAADHLRGFLEHGMRVKLAAAGDAAEGPAIRLAVEPGLDGGREAYRLRVQPGAIEVAGGSPAGVLHGVFRLENRLRERGGPFLEAGEEARRPLFAWRIHRSPLSPFYVEELTGFRGPPFGSKWRDPQRECVHPDWTQSDAGPDMFYHDGILMRLAEHGFNGIWLRGTLRTFARCDAFPEFGSDSDAIVAALNRLCRRAERFGIKVFLYFNEPMGLDDDDPFWESHPAVRGGRDSLFTQHFLCSSTEPVRAYLRQSMEHLFTNVPALGGVILITASEYPSHCYTRGPKTECPRCRERSPEEVVGEVITLIRDGVKAGNPEAQVIAWNWSWNMYEPDPQRALLERLPRDVIVMGDYERGIETQAAGVPYRNEEYSLKITGPSARFTGVADFQRGRGMPTYAKVQIGTTHEFPTVPYTPALQKIAAKYESLRENGVTGLMTCWNFGNMPSLGTELANEFSWHPPPASIDDGVRRVAVRHFGPAAADMVAAWGKVSAAMDDYPASMNILYYGPLSRSPAFPFAFDRIDRRFPRSWLLDLDVEGDRLDSWTNEFKPPQALAAFRLTAERWAEGVALMRKAESRCTGDDRRRLEREAGVAEFCRLQLEGVAHVIEFLEARDALLAAGDPEARQRHLDTLERVCRAERANAVAATALVAADPRLGFHGEGYGYMVDRAALEAKIAGLDEILRRRIPAARGGP